MCDKNAACANNVGSYECYCNVGYEGWNKGKHFCLVLLFAECGGRREGIALIANLSKSILGEAYIGGNCDATYMNIVFMHAFC